ncbi:biotin transporter BioY [Aestuariivirga sp.]|jgi:biotin transport system substrate-specific component|uniref:biotin transporter BioY n=1 Tax=Aestuariivirga sp. TaxID=2650926 RepID=UPI00378530D8
MKTSLLSDRLWPNAGLARNAVLALFGSLLVAAAAQVNVPMLPVPMTLQTLAVLMIGAAYGSRLGAATLALYAFEGAIGLPVFAGFKSGVMLASFGYVLGFIAAAYVVGWLAERGWDRTAPRMFAAMLIGAAVLYVPGLIWLAVWIGPEKAIQLGLLPFLVGDAVKAAIAAVGFPAAWALLGRR